MRSVRDWDISDLDALCQNKAEEGLGLEFKRSPSLDNTSAKREELCKDVSAMANSVGGIIVYGIAENSSGEADFVDDGCDPLSVKPEWFDQVLTSGIEPKISGIIIQPIVLRNGNRAFAIEVPQAVALAPHQARGHKKYYRRNGRIVDSMFDYEIRDLMRRGVVPDLFIRFDIRCDNNEYFLKCFVGNNSSEPALYSMATFVFDNELNVNTPKLEKSAEPFFLNSNGKSHPASLYNIKMGIPNHFPIFKETEWLIFDIKLKVEDNASYPFQYSIRCPGFEKTQSGYISYQNGGISMHIF